MNAGTDSCNWCGQTYTYRRRTSRYCSPACRKYGWRAGLDAKSGRGRASVVQPQAGPREPVTTNCAQCGDPYERSRYRNASAYCSPACRIRASRGGSPKRRKPQEWLTCTGCGASVRKVRNSAPADRVRCRACRSNQTARTCPGCSGVKSATAEVCRACRAKRQTIRASDDSRLVRKHREHDAPGIRWSDRKRLLAKWKRQGKRCAYCDRLADTIDHAVPLVRGGTNYEGNLVAACKSCNSSKGGRTIMEWRTGRKAQRMTRPVEWKPRKPRPRPIKAIKGEQPAFNVCPECGSLCVNRYCNSTCNTRYVTRRNYRLKVGIPLDAPLYGSDAPQWARHWAA